jgi:hypothetical protein
MERMLSLVAQHRLMSDSRAERVALAGEAMQREARDAAFDRWDRTRGKSGFDPLVTAASGEIASARSKDWQRALAGAQATTERRESASQTMRERLRREDVAEQARIVETRRLQLAVFAADLLAAEDMVAHSARKGEQM